MIQLQSVAWEGAMNSYELNNILPLIQEQQLSGRTLSVTFACGTTGVVASARETIDATQSNKELVKHRVKRSFFNAIRGPLSSAIRSIFGQSTAGRLAGDVAGQVAYVAATPQSTMAVSDEQKNRAIVRAFQQVSARFSWDGNSWRGKVEQQSA